MNNKAVNCLSFCRFTQPLWSLTTNLARLRTRSENLVDLWQPLETTSGSAVFHSFAFSFSRSSLLYSAFCFLFLTSFTIRDWQRLRWDLMHSWRGQMSWYPSDYLPNFCPPKPFWSYFSPDLSFWIFKEFAACLRLWSTYHQLPEHLLSFLDSCHFGQD